MAISQKQVEAIINLAAPKRYNHFIKKVVGWQKVWGLYNDGWALSETSDGQPVFPLWPEKEYAELCINGDWSNYSPEPIELDEVLESMIPMLRERNILPGVFFTMEHGSINAEVDLLENDLREELSKYK
jgi:hypothetical protein